jgi:hypothetical protein
MNRAPLAFLTSLWTVMANPAPHERASSLVHIRNGMMAAARTSVLPETIPMGALPANCDVPARRPQRRLRSSPSRKHRPFADGSGNAPYRPRAALPGRARYGSNAPRSGHSEVFRTSPIDRSDPRSLCSGEQRRPAGHAADWIIPSSHVRRGHGSRRVALQSRPRRIRGGSRQ